jgi:transcriptional regulator with PAS, ATPase and Fis domain
MATPGARAHAAAAGEKLANLLRRVDGPATALEALAERSSDGVFLVDTERNVLLFNRRAEELTGVPRGEVIGRNCLAGFRCPRCLEACRVFTDGQSGSALVEIYRSDATALRVRKRAVLLRDRSHRVIGALEVFRAREGALEGAQAEGCDGEECVPDGSWAGAEALMASLGRGLALLDRDARLRRVSTTLAQLAGLEPRELEGQAAASVFGEALFDPESGFWGALLAGERREGWRATLGRAGLEVPVSITGAPLPGECGGGAHSGGTHVLVVRPDTSAAQVAEETGPEGAFEGMVGRSPAMRRVFRLVEHLRDSDATVLVTGESGTGKELVARAVHARSARGNQPFVAVNCGALPANLLDTELFGHVRGSFTGAVRDKPGRFEVVGRGTLFLDEIGDLPLELQVKLLRVLQERLFERVGDVRSLPFQGRVVAATHRDLSRAVSEGRFREDLFYRLNVVHLRLPPLRERREEIEPLVLHLLSSIGQRRSRALRLSPTAMRALLAHDWPGNIRQLENALEYATAVCEGQTIHVEDLPPEVTGVAPLGHPAPPAAATATPLPSPGPPAQAPPLLLEEFPTAGEIVAALRATRGKRSAAAVSLGVSRTTLWRRMRELGLG